LKMDEELTLAGGGSPREEKARDFCGFGEGLTGRKRRLSLHEEMGPGRWEELVLLAPGASIDERFEL